MATGKRHAFTIVELLVVIAIIAMLMGLLVPAVLSARSAARRANCLSNMREVGRALHAEAISKGYFPGRLSLAMNSAGKPMVNANDEPGVTWVLSILANIEQSALLDQLRQLGTIQPPDSAALYIPILICPSDRPAASNIPALSYVVNSGIQDKAAVTDRLLPDSKANGVFHDLRNPATRSALQVSPDYISSNDGTNTTIMISENVDAGYWNSFEELDHGIIWDIQRRVLINIAAGEREANDYTDHGFARPASNHSSGVNVVFCGGNGQFQRDDIDYWVYVQLMTPDGAKAVIDPTTTPPQPLPNEFRRLLTVQDYQ